MNKAWHFVAGAAAGAIAISGLQYNTASFPTGQEIEFHKILEESTSQASSFLAKHDGCVSVHGLPDPFCTSGSVDPDCGIAQVKQKSYSEKVRPSLDVSAPLKREVMRRYGMEDQPSKLVEADHSVPIALCGCPGPGHQCDFLQNYWPQLWTGTLGAAAKDVVEARCLKLVREGKLALSKAQHDIATNWTTACNEK